jgi:uncharacterized protein YjbJ (UPF0337 family)
MTIPDDVVWLSGKGHEFSWRDLASGE